MEDKIKEIVKKAIEGQMNYDEWYGANWEDPAAELLALFTQSVEEDIIGKDEDDGVVIQEFPVKVTRISPRNQLRAEQRARLATLIKQ